MRNLLNKLSQIETHLSEWHKSKSVKDVLVSNDRINIETALYELDIMSINLSDQEGFEKTVTDIQGKLEQLIKNMVKQYGNVDIPALDIFLKPCFLL